jgi:hypothetical protein
MKTLKGPRHDNRLGIRREYHRNNGASSFIGLVEKSNDLPGLPPTDPMRTKKNTRCFYRLNLLSDDAVPEIRRSYIGFIQEGLYVFLGQLLRDLTDGWLVLAVVAQEDIKDFRFGVLSVHTEAIV